MAKKIYPSYPSVFYGMWEQFINDWYNGKSVAPWSDPNLTPLINNPKTKSLSIDYIPEPWWGNHEEDVPLHSVVVNFNPGQGDVFQHRSRIPFHGCYAHNIVDSKVLPLTEKWHASLRAKPIHSALSIINPTGWKNLSLKNHLSVELIPWHTRAIAGCGFDNYLKQNAIQIMEYSLMFAANESKRIANDKLRNVVILKMSKGNTDKLLNVLDSAGYNHVPYSVKTVPGTSSHCYEFSIERIPSVRFVSIWGEHAMNKFPNKSDLKYILDKFI